MTLNINLPFMYQEHFFKRHVKDIILYLIYFAMYMKTLITLVVKGNENEHICFNSGNQIIL